MWFNSKIFCKKRTCFRASWDKGHYLTYDGENFIEHIGDTSRVWFWDCADDAIADLTADDWGYTEKHE